MATCFTWLHRFIPSFLKRRPDSEGLHLTSASSQSVIRKDPTDSGRVTSSVSTNLEVMGTQVPGMKHNEASILPSIITDLFNCFSTAESVGSHRLSYPDNEIYQGQQYRGVIALAVRSCGNTSSNVARCNRYNCKNYRAMPGLSISHLEGWRF